MMRSTCFAVTCETIGGGPQLQGKLRKLASHFWSPQSGPYTLLILLFLTVFVLPPLLAARIFTLLLMIRRFLLSGRAWGHRIAAAVAVYLLLGLIWARLYEAVELLAPGAFRIAESETISSAGFVYFSFVTLATLGYGDFTPVNMVARNLAILEAITGQLYLVILIAKLVSEEVARSGREDSRT
jgi:hypothetical protein